MSLGLLQPDWAAPPNVHAAFTLRSGGVSAAPLDTLNLGGHVGDDPMNVVKNRRRVRTALALPSEPIRLNQVHGAVVHDADAAPPRGVPAADAIVTRRPGVVCSILVADCLPVLCAAADGSVIGAAHAGWRGLAAGVIEQTIAAMAVPAAELRVWLGPCIGPQQFEVGDEVREAFVGFDETAAAHFRANARGRWLCDLPGLARGRLARLGIAAVSSADACTVSDPTRFFSHRRDGHSGRMAALLWMTPAA